MVLEALFLKRYSYFLVFILDSNSNEEIALYLMRPRGKRESIKILA